MRRRCRLAVLHEAGVFGTHHSLRSREYVTASAISESAYKKFPAEKGHQHLALHALHTRGMHAACTLFTLLHTRYCTHAAHAFHTTCCIHAAAPAFQTCCTHAAPAFRTTCCTHATAHTPFTPPAAHMLHPLFTPAAHMLHTRYCTHATAHTLLHTRYCTHVTAHATVTPAAHTLLHTRYCTHATAHTGPTLPTLLRPNNVSRDNAPSWVTPRTRRLARPASTRWSRARTGLYDAALNATMPSGLPSTSRSW